MSPDQLQMLHAVWGHDLVSPSCLCGVDSIDLSTESSDVGEIEISAVGHLHICSQLDMMDLCQGKQDGCYDFQARIIGNYKIFELIFFFYCSGFRVRRIGWRDPSELHELLLLQLRFVFLSKIFSILIFFAGVTGDQTCKLDPHRLSEQRKLCLLTFVMRCPFVRQ